MLDILLPKSILRPLLFPLIWFNFIVTLECQNPINRNRTLRIPNEILQNVAYFSDQPTLFALLQISSTCYDIATPLLYHRLTITSENAGKLFMGLARTPKAARTYRKRLTEEVPKYKKEDSMELPLRLYFPHVPVESEDEEEEEYSFNSSPSRYVYPTKTSHDRKMRLLSWVEHLSIDSLPSRQLSIDFQGSILSLPSVHSALYVAGPFTKVKHLVITSKGVWDMVDWGDRHRHGLAAFHYHPFLNSLSKLITAHSICLTIPTLGADTDQFAQFIYSRLEPYQGCLQGEELARKRTELKDQFRALARSVSGISDSVATAFRCSLRELIIHDHKIGSILCESRLLTNTKFFFANCPCDLPIISEENRRDCYQHVNRKIRLEQLIKFGKMKEKDHVRWMKSMQKAGGNHMKYMERSLELEKSKKWVLVHPSSSEEEEWAGVLQAAIQKVPYLGNLNLEMKMREDVNPCECCGGK